MSLFKYIMTFIGLSFFLYANSSESYSSYVDDSHKTISDKIVSWSTTLDNTLSSWLGNEEDNNTLDKTNYFSADSYKKPLTIDAFFQNDKYFDETDSTFIRLRTDSLFQTRESNKFNVRLSTQMPFSKSRKNFKLFIDEFNLENAKNILNDEEEESRLVPDIGLHYIVPNTDGLRSRYSVGLSGTSPFVRARYNYPLFKGKWEFDPIQSFKYSADDEFEEETNLYIDRSFEDLSLFRVQLHRRTQTNVEGMDYAMAVQYYWRYRANTGLKFSQSFVGNTEYRYELNDAMEPQFSKSFGGIHNYITSISWRENIWRKWFYYEVTPIVNFHKIHDFKPNYGMRIFFDFYFGQFD